MSQTSAASGIIEI